MTGLKNPLRHLAGRNMSMSNIPRCMSATVRTLIVVTLLGYTL